MTHTRAKSALGWLWLAGLVTAIVLRIAGVDPDSGAYRTLSAAVAAGLVGLGLLAIVLWLRLNRRRGTFRSEVHPWIVSLIAILFIGGAYWLLLELLG